MDEMGVQGFEACLPLLLAVLQRAGQAPGQVLQRLLRGPELRPRPAQSQAVATDGVVCRLHGAAQGRGQARAAMFSGEPHARKPLAGMDQAAGGDVDALLQILEAAPHRALQQGRETGEMLGGVERSRR